MLNNSARSISLSRKLIYSAVMLLAVLAVGEAAFRVRAWIRYGSLGPSIRDPMLTYDQGAGIFVPTPGYEIHGARIDIKVNSLGFRGDEFTRRKPANTIRIAVLGASTTFDAEVSSNEATWPEQLQRKLRAAYPGVGIEVINAALGGYVAADNLKNLEHRVLPLDPDLVIYYEANNEIVRDTRKLARENGMADDTFRASPLGTLARYSLLADLVQKNAVILMRGRSHGGKTMSSIPRDLPRHFLSVLDQMRVDLSRDKIRMMLSTFVVKYRRNQDRATQIANADVAFYYMPWMNIDGLLDAMDVYNAAILDYATEHRLPVVDDRDSIPPDAEHFTDCMHLADKGAEAMADRFLRGLQANGLIDELIAKVQGRDRTRQTTGGSR
jgi:lysophospholipase L1-like esterase